MSEVTVPSPCGRSLSAEVLVGAWRLVDYYTRDEDGVVERPLGVGALGLLVYTADGHMSGSMQRAGRAPFATPRTEAVGRAGTDAEVRRAFDDYFGYAGRFAFDQATHTVHHFVELCSVPGWDGRETVRNVERNQDGSLTYVTPTREHAGLVQRAHLVWRRA